MNQQITIADILNSIIRHRHKVVVTFVAVMILVAAAYLLWPRKYGSEGRLFIQLGRTGTGMDPTPGGQSISIQESRETEVLSVAELVKSRAVIAKVVEQVGADEILKSPFDFLPAVPIPELSFSSSPADGNSKADYKKLKRFELACKAIEEELEVSTEKKTCVISVYCTASSPILARDIVSAVLAETQNKHVEVNSVDRSRDFFADKFDEKQDALIAAQQELGDFRNKNGFLSINGAVNTQQSVINKLEVELIDAEVMLHQAQNKLEKIRQQMTKIKPTVSVPTRGVEKLSTEDSKTEFFKLETELKRQEKLFSPSHPRLVLLKESVDSLRQQIEGLPRDRTESVDQLNPVFEKVKVLLVNAVADEISSTSRLEELRRKHDVAMARLVELNGLEVAAGQLNRNVEVAQRELEVFIQKRAEASIIAALDSTNISDVVIAQQAVLPVKHHSPKGSLMMAGGGLLATLVALSVALFLDRNHVGTILGQDDLERELNIPVLVTLPAISSPGNMVG